MAASANVIGVSLGGIFGHCMCTGGAVLGGRQLAAYVAEKTLAVSATTFSLLLTPLPIALLAFIPDCTASLLHPLFVVSFNTVDAHLL